MEEEAEGAEGGGRRKEKGVSKKPWAGLGGPASPYRAPA